MGQGPALTQSATRELHDLIAVQGFYLSLLQEHTGHEIPAPSEVKGPAATAGQKKALIGALQCWLSLLDLAITPLMLRDALKSSTTRATAEALTRYLVQKGSAMESDRDKVDLVTTFLYRECRPARELAACHAAESLRQEAEDFVEELLRILDTPPPELAKEHQHLVQEFGFFAQEVEDLRYFDEITDSELVRRVRDTKACFGSSFYHPLVLANVAVYNAFFGVRFDELFRAATAEIKKFAAKLLDDGSSELSRLSGDVIVRDLAEVEDKKILEQEYGRAREDFNRISKLKKFVDSRRRSARPQPRPASQPHYESETQRAMVLTPLDVQDQEGLLRNVEEMIRAFLEAAGERVSTVVPMRHGNLTLTATEVECFRGNLRGERSFRADFANNIRRLVALNARMTTEMVEYWAKKKTTYLWKPHADALAYLLSAANQTILNSQQVVKVAVERGLTEKVKGINASVVKLNTQMKTVAEALQM
jgi:hypothetical protein